MAMALATNAQMVSSSVARPQLPLSLPSSSSPSSWIAGAASLRPRRLSLSSGAAGPLLSGGLKRSLVGASALPDSHSIVAALDPHSFPVLANLIDPHWYEHLFDHVFDHLFDPQLDPSKFPVSIQLNPNREIIEVRPTGRLSKEFIKTFYFAWALVFSWGCCVFASMNDDFYESDYYRDAGGNGTGHWIYDQMAREERLAREEMWSDDLMKEIEDKS